MLPMMKDSGPRQQKYLIKDDKTWIFWDNNHREMWARDPEHVIINAKQMILSKKRRCYRHGSRTRASFRPQRQEYNSQSFTEIVFSSLVASLSVCGPKLKATAPACTEATPNCIIPHSFFEKRKNMDSSMWRSRFIRLTWHLVTSYRSVI
jgi:hypothetical protein